MTSSTAVALLDIQDLLARKDEEFKESGTDTTSKGSTIEKLNKRTAGPIKGGRKRKRDSQTDETEPFVYKCSVCDKEFLSKSGARGHEKYQHTKAKLFCMVCNKPFKFHYDLDRHMKTHTGVRPFECQDCDKTFVCKSSLMQHVRLKHIVGNIYNCMVCDKSFYTESDLKRHSAVHYDNKPFKCGKCMKTFTCKSSLNLHLRNHGEKKFACSYCNMHFHVQSDLKRHVTVHTGERPWRCRICNKGYSCKSTLSVHLKQAHTDTPTPDMYIHEAGSQASTPAQDGSTPAASKHNTAARGNITAVDTGTESEEETSEEDSYGDTDMESNISLSEAKQLQDSIDILDIDEVTNITSEIKPQPNQSEGSTTNRTSTLITPSKLSLGQTLERSDHESDTEEPGLDPYQAIDALNKQTREDNEVIPVALFKSQKRGRKPDFVRKLEISGECVLLYKP